MTKEQLAKFEELEARLTKLEMKSKEMDARIKRLEAKHELLKQENDVLSFALIIKIAHNAGYQILFHKV